MDESYDAITASHYAAFRPELHALILRHCIEEGASFDQGLDIGSGTGQSAIALANYCARVIGLEPSNDMLRQAKKHTKVKYLQGTIQDLDLTKRFDILTLAGSLYYAKSQFLVDAIIRLALPDALVIVYDFDVLLDQMLSQLGVDISEKTTLVYNHQENFSGLRQGPLNLKQVVLSTVSLTLTPSECSHLLLSSKENYALLALQFGRDNLYHTTKAIVKNTLGVRIQVKAQIYYSLYRLKV